MFIRCYLKAIQGINLSGLDQMNNTACITLKYNAQRHNLLEYDTKRHNVLEYDTKSHNCIGIGQIPKS